MARALQGAGGAVLFPVGRILVLRTASKAEIVPAIGLTIWPALFAPVLGPAIGGFITEYISWHWNFWINLPLGITTFVLVSRIIPADIEFRKRSFDAVGFVLTGITLAAATLWLRCAGAGLGAGGHRWRPHSHRAPSPALQRFLAAAPEHPLLDLRTLRIRDLCGDRCAGGRLMRAAI